MDFGPPNAEIGRKMANGQLLFLALQVNSIISINSEIGVSQNTAYTAKQRYEIYTKV